MIKKRMKIIGSVFAILAIIGGIYSGQLFRNYRNSKTVIFRISTPKEMIEYDLLSAMKYLQYKFEKQGYIVHPWRYPGNFYHQRGDNAAINVFIRSNEFFYDTRMNKNAVNIYYLHRFLMIYAEELQGYNHYISSQKNLFQAMPNRTNISYLDSGAIPHKRLTPKYKYDILYISNLLHRKHMEILQQKYTYKYYNETEFAILSEKEKQSSLSQARIVVYESTPLALDDEDYIPYATYDIISYGRPLITAYHQKLSNQLGQNIYYYHNTEDIFNKITQALSENDKTREEKANRAREKAITDSENKTFKIPQQKNT